MITEFEVIELLRTTLNRSYSYILAANNISVITGDLNHGKYTCLHNIEESLQAISEWPLNKKKLKIRNKK